MLEHVRRGPAYPLVFLLFWGAVVLFALLDGAPPARLRRGPAERPSPLDDVPAPARGRCSATPSSRCGCSATRAGADARGDLLGLRDPDDRHRRPRHLRAGPGGHLVRRSTAGCGGSWSCRTSSSWSCSCGRLRVLPAARRRSPARLTLSATALHHPAAHRWRRRDRVVRRGVPAARYGDITRRVRRQRLAGPAPVARADCRPRGRASSLFWWAHIALVASSSSTCRSQAPPHRHGFFNATSASCAPRGELPAMDLEARGRDVRRQDDRGPVWKDLLDGFTCTECGRCQEACPAWATGKPLNPKTMIMGIREMAVEAEHGLALIPSPISVTSTARRQSPDARAGDADRRHRDPVRRGLGLRHLRRLRRGVPGDHRARRQDRRAAPQPRPRGVALPGRAHHAFTNMERSSNPGASRRRPGSTGRRACRSRCRPSPRWPRPTGSASSTSSTGSAVRRRSTSATAGSRGRSSPASRRPASGTRSSARRSRAPATRLAGWATTTSTRCSRPATSTTWTGTPTTIVTACPHCFNTIGNEYGQLGGTTRWSTTRVTCAGCSRRAAGDRSGRARRDRRRGIAAGPSRSTTRATWPATTASSPSRATCWAPCPGIELIEMERSRASRRSAAAPAAAGCGWRRSAARASTRSGPARRSTPGAGRRSPPHARSAW